MEKSPLDTVYHAITAAFSVTVVIANIFSAKMVDFPFLELSAPVGVIIYPLTFLFSDLVTEIFGPKKSKLMVYIAFVMCVLSFGLIQLALALPTNGEITQGAFQIVLGLSGLRIFSSLVAYILAQIADIQIYTWIKNLTGSRFMWLRNNGSTCLSQMIDTVVIDTLFLYWGMGMEMRDVLPIMCFSYLYKAFFSVASTPLLYIFVFLIKKVEKTLNPVALEINQYEVDEYEQ